MQTHFGITSTGTNDTREQHMDVAGTHYMDSLEQYIAQNVERWTGWNAQWKFTEVSGWNSQQQYMALMSTVQTLRNGNASMQNEDMYNGDECNYSRQANEKGGTWQLELLSCNASYDLMNSFGPKLWVLNTTQDSQRYVLHIHSMNLHKQEACFVSFT